MIGTDTAVLHKLYGWGTNSAVVIPHGFRRI